MQESIVVVGFDKTLATLVARTLRSRQVYAVIVAPDAPACEREKYDVRGLILAAAPRQELPSEALRAWAEDAPVPVLALGACVPALCGLYGGEAEPVREHDGGVTLWLKEGPLFAGMSGGERVMHALSTLALPEALAALATATEQVIGFEHAEKRLYALQYPIERNDPDGAQLLENFALGVCGMPSDWDEEHIIEHALAGIRAAVGEGKALCAVSGGVDSAVCAKLAHMALGDRLVCVFIDTGLLRQGEAEQVVSTMMDSLGLVVAYVDTQETFLNALAGVTAEADKQRIVSSLLWQVLLKQLSFEPEVTVLLTGSTYTDRLGADAPERTEPFAEERVALLSPVSELFKDEVRSVAEVLKLPAHIAHRQPFPESGLATRIVGDVTADKLRLLRDVDALFTEEIQDGGFEKKLWQYYAMLLPNPAEPYGDAVLLRAVQEADGHAYAARLPYDLLERMVRRVHEQYPAVGRVVYDLTPSRHYERSEAY